MTMSAIEIPIHHKYRLSIKTGDLSQFKGLLTNKINIKNVKETPFAMWLL